MALSSSDQATRVSSRGAATNRRLLALITLLLAFFLCACAGELLVRFGTGDKDYALEMWRYARVLKRVTTDPAQVFAHRPGVSTHLMGVDVRINSKGLRGPEIEYDKPPGVRRVLLLGDSLTFGWGVAEAESIGPALEQQLNDGTSGPWQVINSGVGNYNTRLEVRYLAQQGLRYEPDLVLLDYFINDAEEDPRYSGNVLSMNSALWVFLANRTDVLARLVSATPSWKEYYAGLYRPDAPGWRGATEAMSRLGGLCRAHSTRCAVVNLPELHELRPYPFTAETKLVEQAATNAGLPFVDLLPAVQDQPPSSLWVSSQDAHPNGACDQLYARPLRDAVLRLVGAPQ